MPKTHTFEPSVYHTTIGWHEPVLRIQSGDTVQTRTVDSGGQDFQLQQVTEGGNPQTGPFYVEGAEAGDVLAVRFDRIVPNRRLGRTSSVVALNVVEPAFVRELPAEAVRGEWDVDVEQGVATVQAPQTAIGGLAVALDPMLGCFGVAPPRRQAISCGTSGVYGGNMDYRGFRSGVTVYFPVFAPGALFHLGDGHGTQGDGEITGNGTEISMDVTFTAWVQRKNHRINWPRAEDDQYLMAVGNARPLDQALQHATTELMRWLHEDFGLDYRALSLLFGQAIRYDVGNVFDPAYTMVAKIEKTYVERFRQS